MFAKSTVIPLSPFCSFYKALTSKSKERLARHSATSPSTVRKPSTHVQTPLCVLLTSDYYPADNKVLIVTLGGLTPLIRQMLSPNVEVQCNAVGCITNLATHEENKAKIARSGALGPLTRLAKSRDMRVQRNATGALLNMTHSGKSFDHLGHVTVY